MKTHLLFTCLALLSIVIQSCGTSTTKSANNLPLPVASASAPADYAYLLKKYVTPDGVRYESWVKKSEDIAKLNKVTDYYAQNTAPADEQAALAWHLNAYNAWILQKIMEDWPNEGPLDVSLLFFHKKSIVVSGQRISFVHLENKIIREQFKEPRLHFALNCASASCPPLYAQPFTAQTLDTTLQSLTLHFINQNPYALETKGDEVYLSKIFDWYQEDFGGDDQLINYINKYRTQKIPTNKKIKFQPYNWKLNITK